MNMTYDFAVWRQFRFDRAATAVVFLSIAVLVLRLAVGGAALAQTSSAKDAVAETNVSAPTISSRNTYLSGSSVRAGRVIEGDFVGAGGKVSIDQPVKGDVMAVGGSVDIRAAVGDDVRVAGGDVNIENTIGGELFASGANIALSKAVRVAGHTALYGGTVVIDGKIDGPLRVGARTVTVNGELNGETRFRAEVIEVGPTAKINGALFYSSPNELKRMEGATITGAITRLDGTSMSRERDMSRADRDWHGRTQRSGIWVGSIFTFVALLACAAVLLLVFPAFSANASETIKTSPWLTLAVGFGAIVGVPILAALLFVTVLGIPLGIIALALYPALLLMGYVVGVLFVARRAQVAMRKGDASGFSSVIGFFALALLLVMLMSRLPFVGWLVLFVITAIGFGALILEIYSRRQASPPSGHLGSVGAQIMPTGV
jgi:cytoskeletal protein CcmA (bactofilin family)